MPALLARRVGDWRLVAAIAAADFSRGFQPTVVGWHGRASRSATPEWLIKRKALRKSMSNSCEAWCGVLTSTAFGRDSGVADEGVSKVDLRYLFSPKGTNSIDGGTAPGWQPPFDQPCKGCITPMRCNPYRVGRRFDLYRGRCPRLLNLSPSGTRSDDEGVLTHPLTRRGALGRHFMG